MKYYRFMAASAVAAIAALVLGLSALAQVPSAGTAPPRTAPSAGGSMAVINMAYLFDHHPRLKADRVAMKADIEKADQYFKGEAENVRKMIDGLEKYRGGPEYKQREEEIAKRNNDLNLQKALQRKEFMLREARMVYNTYQEIAKEVDYYCKQNGIDAVVRFNAPKVDLEVPETVVEAVNQQVIWYNPERDITGVIYNTMMARYGTTPGAAAEGGTTPPRPRLDMGPAFNNATPGRPVQR